MNFDFITNADFRASLESDYGEMVRCADSAAWKSVLVLAGSIVEALLIDYVAAAGQTGGKDPLKMDLSEAVALCRKDGVLTDRTSDLSSVIRSYRNLIHPGRVIRLGEAAPNESSATIATALVKLIVDEVAEKRKAAFGLTGEQIIAKLRRDPGALVILKHLLGEVSDTERTRLVLDLIPATYFELVATSEGDPYDAEIQERLRKAYRIVLATLPFEVDQAAAAKFVEILKSDDGTTISMYARAFFTGHELDNVNATHQPLVKDFLLSQMQPSLRSDVIEMLIGFEGELKPHDAIKWVDPIMKALTSGVPSEARSINAYFTEGIGYTTPAFDRSVEKRLTEWEEHFIARDARQHADIAAKLKVQVPPPAPPSDSQDKPDDDDELPF